MVNAEMNKDMLDILKSLEGEKLCCLKYEDAIKNEAYGNLRIETESFAVEISNELEEMMFFGSTEELSRLKCSKKMLHEAYIPCAVGNVGCHEVNKKITFVEIVNDKISVNDGEYEISSDMAIIIGTEKGKYILARGWFFNEVIKVERNKDIDEIYSTKEVVCDWSDDGENKVEVKRSVRRL